MVPLPMVLTLILTDDAHPTWVGCHCLLYIFIKYERLEGCCRIFNNKIYEEIEFLCAFLIQHFSHHCHPSDPVYTGLMNTKGNQHLHHQQLLLEVSNPQKIAVHNLA